MKMAKQEFVMQVLEQGSNTMSTYAAMQSMLAGKRETLNLIVDSSVLVATISNITPILQPFCIITNFGVATTIAVKIDADWQEPQRRVQSGDVLTLMSSAGTIALTFLAWAELGAAAAVGVYALVLAADLVNVFAPYMNSLSMYGQLWLPKYLPMDPPIVTDTSNLHWARFESKWQVATYEEIMSSVENAFICLDDMSKSGWALVPVGSCIPGSITPIDENAYRENYCNRKREVEQWSDTISGMYYCTRNER
jgi:hypothetical protein